jgi:hypothetical protein
MTDEATSFEYSQVNGEWVKKAIPELPDSRLKVAFEQMLEARTDLTTPPSEDIQNVSGEVADTQHPDRNIATVFEKLLSDAEEARAKSLLHSAETSAPTGVNFTPAQQQASAHEDGPVAANDTDHYSVHSFDTNPVAAPYSFTQDLIDMNLAPYVNVKVTRRTDESGRQFYYGDDVKHPASVFCVFRVANRDLISVNSSVIPLDDFLQIESFAPLAPASDDKKEQPNLQLRSDPRAIFDISVEAKTSTKTFTFKGVSVPVLMRVLSEVAADYGLAATEAPATPAAPAAAEQRSWIKNIPVLGAASVMVLAFFARLTGRV